MGGELPTGPRTKQVVTETEPDNDRSLLVWTGTEYGLFWRQHPEGEPGHIRQLRLTPEGEPIGEEFVVYRGLNLILAFDIVWNGSEYGIVVEEYSREMRGTVLYFSRLSNLGALLVEPILLTQDRAVYSLNPKLVWNGRQYSLIWVAAEDPLFDEEHDGRTLMFLRIMRDGERPDGVLALTDDRTRASQVSLVWTGTEHGLVWIAQREAPDRDPREVRFMSLTEVGEILTDEVLVTEERDVVGAPSIVWDGSEFGVAWQRGTRDQDDEIQSMDILFTRVGTDGVPIGEQTMLVEGGYAETPRLAWTGTELTMTWLFDSPDVGEDHDEGWRRISFGRVSEGGESFDHRLTVFQDREAPTVLSFSHVSNSDVSAVVYAVQSDDDPRRSDIFFASLQCFR